MTLIPITHWKLREAKFFMGKLAQEERINNLDREDFSYYLSAFLSAGRSVTFFLENEQSASYKAWFQPVWMKNLPPEESQFMDFMNAQRVAAVHCLGAETQEDVTMVPLAHALAHDLNPLYLAYADTGAPGAISEIGQNVYYFGVNGKQEKAVDVCRRYLDLLVRLVTDFDLAFP
jgi:hypothetical protein